MRLPQFISPSALSLWQSNKEEYYLRYLAENPPPRMLQTQAMSIGSSFDAYVKSYMFERLFGKGSDPQFELDTIFETQVEEQNRDWAREAGAHVFDCYKKLGALADLLTELESASGTPRFEFTVSGTIGDVPLLGKPDVWYVTKDAVEIILDFKVNGYCSDYPTYPKRGYVKLRPDGTEHKKAHISKVKGVKINIAEFMESIDSSWAQQLATYAWLCGTPVGEFFIVAIDQLVCNGSSIKVAEHRSQISPDFQQKILNEYQGLWATIRSGHIFRDRSYEESKARCDILDLQYAAYTDGNDFIRELTNR